MRKIAINACHELARWIFETGGSCQSPFWVLADRIEKRFAIAGATEWQIKRLADLEADYKQEQTKIANLKHPDRLTYLFR